MHILTLRFQRIRRSSIEPSNIKPKKHEMVSSMILTTSLVMLLCLLLFKIG